MSQIPSNLPRRDTAADAQPTRPHVAHHTNGSSPPEPRQTMGYLLVLLGPILAVGAFTALLAMGVGLAGWYRMEMLAVAAGTGVLVAAITLGLLYVHLTDRRADQLALQSAQARVARIVESAMDAIISVNQDQRIVLFNSAAELVFGCPRDQAIGSPLSRFIPERFRAGHVDNVRQFGQTGTSSRRMGAQRIVTGLRSNGEEFPIDASISQHTEEDGKFYTVILRDVTARVRAEEALRQSKEELRDLAMTASTVREQEKSRISRELHDELAQSLTALKMDTAWLLDLVPAEQTAVVGKLHSMQDMLDTTVASTRRISADLRPLILDDLGLVPAAEWLAQNFEERNSIPCNLSADQELELDDPHATAIFRILQESLTNVAKHACATRVDVLLKREQDRVILEVRDDGVGFATQDPRKPNSYGLAGLRERAHLLEGEVSVESNPGHGTHIKVSIPVDKAARQ